MDDSVRMKLVFRLDGVGFALDIGDLAEIREGQMNWLDATGEDMEPDILGSLSFRGRKIPVRDLRRRFRMGPGSGEDTRVLLVVADSQGPWGLMADRVEGVFPADEFTLRSLPSLLTGAPDLGYEKVAIWREEPLVLFEVDRISRCREAG